MMMVVEHLFLSLWILLAASSSFSRAEDGGGSTDQFTYRNDVSDSTNIQWPPEEWINVRCDTPGECAGWPEAFQQAVDWELEENDCLWCPASGNDCGTHHQSPINLQRHVAVNSSEFVNYCIDVHWMKYYDSTCTWDQLVELKAFSIERHALKIRQPIEEVDGDYRIACSNGGRRFGRIDFSKGFSAWWLLSHVDFHVPSEHTQEGRRYDGEMQFYHVYSISAEEAGVANQMAAVTIFLTADKDTPDYDMLNKIICQWRKAEEETREQCGLPSIESRYPGCFQYSRTGTSGGRNLRTQTNNNNNNNGNTHTKIVTAHDILLHNHKHSYGNASYTPIKLIEDEFVEPEINWEEFVADVYRQEQESLHGRRLMDYDHVGPWHNYFGMLGVKTEYYYRYSGTQTVPPCYAKFLPGTRANTNHWRVMKDPIRISERQLDEMHRLLKDRIAPVDDPIRACQPDTAAAPYEGNENRVNVSRPLQETHKAHYITFCECNNWKSKWLEDQAWCENEDQLYRFYEQPYNFKTDSF